MSLADSQTKGLRLRDMPDEWFINISDTEMNNPMLACIPVFNANRMLDKMEFEATLKEIKRLDNMNTAIVGLHKCLLISDQIYLELILGEEDSRKKIISTLYTKEQKSFMKQMKNFPSVIRTNYAIALAKKKNTDKLTKQFEKVTKTYPYSGEIESEIELMAKAKEVLG